MAVTVNTSGLMTSSGFDVQALVDQMIQAAQAPENLWKKQQATLSAQTSALNSLSSKLATLHSSVDSLSDVLGVFTARTATSSDPSVATASADSAAANAAHTVVVSSYATKAVYYSTTTVESGDTELSGGTITISTGSNTSQIAIGGGTDTLNKIASSINFLAIGVTASVISDAAGTKLAVVSNDTGKANDITLTTSSDSALAFDKSSDGENAIASIDGIPIFSANNEFDNVFPGLSLQLNGGKTNIPVTIKIDNDTGRVTQAINDFVSGYNALITAVNAQFNYDQNSGTAGVLSGDAAVRTLEQRLMETVSGVNVKTSAIQTLHGLGITTNDDGTLTVDSTVLDSALQSQFSAVQNFFQDSELGFATKLNSLMNAFTDSVKGPFVVDLKSISEQQNSLTDSINDFEDRLTLRRQQLVDQMSQVNALLQQLPSMQNEIDAMLGTLTNSSSKK